MSVEHAYQVRCSWRGSTGVGYEHYQREHAASAPPALDSLVLSADRAFLGQPDRLNPEQLVVIAAASSSGSSGKPRSVSTLPFTASHAGPSNS